MTPTPDPQAVREAIDAYIARYSESEHQVAQLARRFVVLPLYPDWTGFIGLSPSGELVWIEYDNPTTPKDAEVTEYARWRAGIRHLAFAVGALRYPELHWLLPIRTPDCVACTVCNGTGRPLLQDRPAPGNIICECGGTGWLPPAAN